MYTAFARPLLRGFVIAMGLAASHRHRELPRALGSAAGCDPFEVRLNPAKIDSHHAYAIRAQIVVEGQLRFVNDRAYPVLTQGHPSHVEVNLRPVEASAPTYP